MIQNTEKDNPLISLTWQLMYAVKSGADTRQLIDEIGTINFVQLKPGLMGDDEKKAFWINVYNGFTQVLLKMNPDIYNDRKTFFTLKQIVIAGNLFSLDDIEHGILRRSKMKPPPGDSGDLMVAKSIKSLRVKLLDYRLHFALNCGAKSCPPIICYNADNIEQQLNQATAAYLNGEAIYDELNNTLGLPALMSWFAKDFGGHDKILQIVKQAGIIPQSANPAIYFTAYNWQLLLNNYY